MTTCQQGVVVAGSWPRTRRDRCTARINTSNCPCGWPKGASRSIPSEGLTPGATSSDTRTSQRPPQLGRGRLERFIHDGSSSPTYERALLDAVRNAKTPAVGSKPIQATAPRNDDVLLVGTNVDSVATERRVLSTATKTHFVGRDDTGTIQIGGARFGLALQEGEPPSPDSVALRSAFERTLGLPHEKAAAVVAVLTRASPGAREELAAIADLRPMLTRRLRAGRRTPNHRTTRCSSPPPTNVSASPPPTLPR